MASAVNVAKLSKSFGAGSVLNGLSLQIDEHDVYGLVGLNGAGKTTLIRLLLGLLRNDTGIVSVLGYTPWNHEEAFYRCTGVVLENDGFAGNLTVRENLQFYAAARQLAWTDTERYLQETWSHTPLLTSIKKVKHLSRGQRMQCALCRAFMGWPRMLFLDEPVIALDLEAYDHFRILVHTAREHGSTVLISSHQLDTIDDLCTRVGILQDKVIRDLPLEDASGRNRWLIDSPSEHCGSVLESAGAVDISHQAGRWRFTMEQETETIPEIIKKLVEHGCELHEICRDRDEFSDAIRRFYHGTGLSSGTKGPSGTGII